MIGPIIAIGMVLVVLFLVLVFHAYEIQRLEERADKQAELLSKMIIALNVMTAKDVVLHRTVSEIINTP